MKMKWKLTKNGVLGILGLLSGRGSITYKSVKVPKYDVSGEFWLELPGVE